MGLPLHPLVVHAAIVLVPVTAILAVIIAVSDDRRNRWGVLTWILATVAWGMTIVAKFSGENLFAATVQGVPPEITDRHATYGQTSVWFVLALWLAVSALLLLDMDRKRRDGFGSAVLPTVLSLFVIGTAMAAAGQVLLTAWTGAESFWGSPVG
jgi:uncharacterized membrane protein